MQPWAVFDAFLSDKYEDKVHEKYDVANPRNHLLLKPLDPICSLITSCKMKINYTVEEEDVEAKKMERRRAVQCGPYWKP